MIHGERWIILMNSLNWNSYWMQFGLNLRLVYIVLSQVSLIDDIVKQTLNTYEYLYVICIYTHIIKFLDIFNK